MMLKILVTIYDHSAVMKRNMSRGSKAKSVGKSSNFRKFHRNLFNQAKRTKKIKKSKRSYKEVNKTDRVDRSPIKAERILFSNRNLRPKIQFSNDDDKSIVSGIKTPLVEKRLSEDKAGFRKSKNLFRKNSQKTLRPLIEFPASVKTSIGTSASTSSLSTYKRKFSLPKNFSKENSDFPYKKKVKTWLVDNLYCHSRTNFSKLHKTAKNGIFIFDLINKIQRNNVLQGKNFVDTPKNVRHNFLKIFNFLKKQQRFNPRYLDQQGMASLIEGKAETFWGFLADLYFWSKNKINPHDKRYEHLRESSRSNGIERRSFFKNVSKDQKSSVKVNQLFFNTMETEEDEVLLRKKPAKSYFLTKSPLIKANRQYTDCSESLEEFEQIEKQQSSLKFALNDTQYSDDSHSFNITQSTKKQSQFLCSKNLPKSPKTPLTKSQISINFIKTAASLNYQELMLLEEKLKAWLTSLDYSFSSGSFSILEDTIRNGFILCSLATKIYKLSEDIFKIPKTPKDCLNNIRKSLEFFCEDLLDLEASKQEIVERIVKGDYCIIWPFLARVFKLYQDKAKSDSENEEGFTFRESQENENIRQNFEISFKEVKKVVKLFVSMNMIDVIEEVKWEEKQWPFLADG
jgi:hypothetical protein